MTKKETNNFRRLVYAYYKTRGRNLPWRKNITPYSIVVSEIMLQQTQVDRVIPKFLAWMKKFPDFKTLSKAPLREVLKLWQGLGYNRRAIALQRIAQKVVSEHNGKLPNDPEILETFPGIGRATAASIVVYAYNKPAPFIETNVRTVFIHCFFKDKKPIHDKDILPLVQATLDSRNPRRWFYALMDYGVYLKKLHKNPSRRSAHYVRQSKFEGSNRQVRGMILKLLLAKSCSLQKLKLLLPNEEGRLEKNLEQLEKEGFITKYNNEFKLS